MRRAGPVAALVVVAGLFALALFGVRHSMQQRRVRAERAFREATQCVLGSPLAATETGPRGCAEPARAAQRAVLELPEHARRQLELAAALGELAEVLQAGNDTRLAGTLNRVLAGGSALGWHSAANPR